MFLFLTGLLFFGFTPKNNQDEVKDYLNVPGPLTFDKTDYNLTWSSHPSDIYYMQEYIPKGDNIDKFKNMVLLNVIASDSLKLEAVVALKLAELTKLQKENPVIQFKSYDNSNTGEHIIDFLLSANEPDGKHLSFVERNVYRYKYFVDKSGQKGILLFGVSTRAYGHDIYKFFSDLKEHRTEIIPKVGDFSVPEITLTK
ncbi:MAG: hypothetical protein EKK37_12680 [Sphingobacteriales bacterium]|nr:MAG: hypothetical protein EKK37_12680 [Sphingobacteriales bacterium]